MLMRFDPFRDLDGFLRRPWDSARPAGMQMDAYRRGDEFVVHLDLPGVDGDSIDVTVERNVLSVTAERVQRYAEGDQVLASERWAGKVTRQLFLGTGLATDRIAADYHDGVLTLTIPVAEEAKPQRIAIRAGETGQHEVAASSSA